MTPQRCRTLRRPGAGSCATPQSPPLYRGSPDVEDLDVGSRTARSSRSETPCITRPFRNGCACGRGCRRPRLPVEEELRGPWVEEHEPRNVERHLAMWVRQANGIGEQVGDRESECLGVGDDQKSAGKALVHAKVAVRGQVHNLSTTWPDKRPRSTRSRLRLTRFRGAETVSRRPLGVASANGATYNRAISSVEIGSERHHRLMRPRGAGDHYWHAPTRNAPRRA